jgi:citrate/tricarballylate utilization protein
VSDLFAEAERQLTICNACRYCEGYCAVFPALERRLDLADGDITHLADLCHDCRDCYTACMYAPPHEFALNLPAALSAVRRHTYDEYLPRVPWPRTRRGAMLAAGLAAVAIFAVVAVLVGGGAGAAAGSPYRVIAYPALLAAFGLLAAWSVVVMALSAARYWRATNGRGLASPAAVAAAVRQAATLRNLRGGGAGCSYPGDEPSAARRRLHGLVAWGFAACVASTVAAAISQDFAGDPPPYPAGSAPVLLGIAGGAGLVIGCAGLLALRRADRRLTEDPAREDPALARRGYALLTGLLLLAVSGLLTLALRDTAAFAPVLAVHLAAVAACFAIAPYTKFMHVVYRFLALVHDSAEISQKIPGGAGRKAALRLRGGEHDGEQVRAASRWDGGRPAARARRPRHVQQGPAGGRHRRGVAPARRAPLHRVPARRDASDRRVPGARRRTGPVPARGEALRARRDRGRGQRTAPGGAAAAA